MELFLLILVIGVPFLIVFLINKKQEQETNELFDQKLEDIDLDEYNKQEGQEIDNKINTLQNDLIFTKDYIKNLHSDKQLRILKSKDLIRAYHYVFSKAPIGSTQCKRYKFIVLEFKDDLFFFIEDTKNKQTLSKWYKHNEQFNFDNIMLELIKKYYPHIKIGFETDNNDIRVFNTQNKASTLMDGLRRKKTKATVNKKITTHHNINQKINFCSKCGYKLDSNANFCNNCGEKIKR